MSAEKEDDKKKLLIDSDSEDQDSASGSGSSTGTGSGGSDSGSGRGDTGTDTGSGGVQGGGIEFVDFTSTFIQTRDDLLSPAEKKRLLATHKDLNEIKVKQQKEKREHYKDLKNGKVSLQSHRAGMGANSLNSQFKTNPILANKAQFSGIDKTVSVLPNELIADTNQDKQDELVNELRNQLGYQSTPKFNPKPRGPGW
jgi:hypothetical protein